MTQSASITDTTSNTWRVPATFWVANIIELFGRAAYAHAHVIWWVFAAVGVAAFTALMILKRSEPRASTP